VSEYSDEPGAATRAGDLGELTRDQLQQPFADAAFSLDLNQMSDVVETESGFHLILRIP
jgi:parvulin-like peptidyl-prolyl isomerase